MLFGDDFPSKTNDSRVRENSEVVIIYPENVEGFGFDGDQNRVMQSLDFKGRYGLVDKTLFAHRRATTPRKVIDVHQQIWWNMPRCPSWNRLRQEWIQSNSRRWIDHDEKYRDLWIDRSEGKTLSERLVRPEAPLCESPPGRGANRSRWCRPSSCCSTVASRLSIPAPAIAGGNMEHHGAKGLKIEGMS